MNKTCHGQPPCLKVYEKTETGSRQRSMLTVTIVESSYGRSECCYGYGNQLRHRSGGREGKTKTVDYTLCTHEMHEELSSLHINISRYREALVTF
jgi:hypothetical protein